MTSTQRYFFRVYSLCSSKLCGATQLFILSLLSQQKGEGGRILRIKIDVRVNQDNMGAACGGVEISRRLVKMPHINPIISIQSAARGFVNFACSFILHIVSLPLNTRCIYIHTICIAISNVKRGGHFHLLELREKHHEISAEPSPHNPLPILLHSKKK